MHPRQLVFLVGIAIVATACSGSVPPALAGASPAAVTAPASPAPSRSAAPSSAPTPGAGVTGTQLASDARGDAAMADGAKAPGYLDMLAATVELRDGAFVFTQVLASGVPPTPELADGVLALGWSFCIDLDPSQSLRGYPLGRASMPCELVVQTRWDGMVLRGMVFDRRPLADKNEVKTITLAPATDGSAISETVPFGLLGEATTFQWSAYIDELGALGTDVLHVADTAPDGGTSRPVSWPAN